MKFHVLTLFPEMIQSGCDSSILKRAIQKDLIGVNAIDIRDFSEEKHRQVDDYTYGGGAGMLMQAQPVYNAWQSVTAGKEESCKPRTIYVTPQGKTFTQELAEELSSEQELIFLCGHYEGIDERVLEEVVTDRVSIGDYVLTGGELPALVMIDAISRLIPGVLGSDESATTETFHKDLIEYPQYSRPEVWHDKAVPKVLLSGDHKKIEAWRLKQSEERTKLIRPDLYEKYLDTQALLKLLCKKKKDNAYLIDCLMRGDAKILHWKEDGKSVQASAIGKSGIGMICCDTAQAGREEMQYLKDARCILHNCEELKDVLIEEFGYHLSDECFQSVYTQHNALPIGHKDIRLYPIEELKYAADHYGTDSENYIRDRIERNAFFAAYEGDRIVGFCGIHRGGSLGILYVDTEYRRSNIGSSLASYLVNKSIEMGGLPYAHIRIANIASLKMQEKMGLYIADKRAYWMGKS